MLLAMLTVSYVGSFDYNVYATDLASGRDDLEFPTGSFVESTPTFADGLSISAHTIIRPML